MNTLSPGDRVLGVSIGSFGDRFANIAGVYGADVSKLDAEWGYAAAAEEIRERLRGMPDTKAVLLTHNETSTGVMNPIPELAAAIRDETPDALILVDSVSGLGAVPFEMDAWGVDVVVTGSQKAWMSAPGLAMIAASSRARAAMEHARMPRFYLDLRAHREAATGGETPFTPAIAVVFQVDEGLRLMQEEGAEAIFARHEAVPLRHEPGWPALGSELFADERHYSRTVTAATLPDDLDWKAFNGDLKSRGLVLAGGQGKLKGRIFRLGHLGSVTLEEILGAIATLEAVSIEHGEPSNPARPSPPPSAPRWQHRASSACRWPGRPREGPRRRERRARGHRTPHRSPRGRRARRLHPRGARGDAARVRRPHRAQPGAGRCRADLAGARLVVIGRAGVGVDNVDLDAATRAGITVVNAPTGNTIAAAEHTLALLYGVARHDAAADASLRPANGTGASSRGWSCAAGRSGSSGWARSARRSRFVPRPWRWSSSVTTRT